MNKVCLTCGAEFATTDENHYKKNIFSFVVNGITYEKDDTVLCGNLKEFDRKIQA